MTEDASALLLDHPGKTAVDLLSTHTARVMLLDDEPAITEVLKIYLEDAGYTDIVATNDAFRALELLRSAPPDLLITDLMMPDVDGFEILRQMRADLRLSRIPVVMLTSYKDSKNKLRALELGATDFLTKPVDPSELVLRLRNNLAVKAYQDQLQQAYQQSHRLLLSILPPSVAERLEVGETDVVDCFEEATVLFADLVGLTNIGPETDAAVAAQQLNQVFKAFDQFVDERGLEKIKTIGDSYMLVGGLSQRRADHASAVVDAGLAMLSIAERLAADGGANFQLRVSAHTGPVVAGVIGANRFYYDLWGDTVNVASRMESTSKNGRLQISDVTRRALGDNFRVEARGAVDIKGNGAIDTYFVLGKSN